MNDEQVRLLLDLREAATKRDDAEVIYAAATEATRELVVRCLAADVAPSVVARTAGISRQRVWQLRQRE